MENQDGECDIRKSTVAVRTALASIDRVPRTRMAEYKHIDTSPQLLPVDLRQHRSTCNRVPCITTF